jgi:hypothetical protein
MWITSTTAPDTAPNDAFVPDQDGISDKVLVMPNIAIASANAVLSFRNNFDTEFSDGIFWDGFVLEVSSPNIAGGAFLDITDPLVGGSFVSGGYTGTIDTTANNPLAGRMAWSANSNGYINSVINLGPNVAGQTIRMRFRMGTDEAVAAPGVRIDTLAISSTGCGPTPTATATATGSPSGTPCGSFNENFDGVTAPALPAGWVASNATGGAPLWVTSTTTPDTPPNAAFIDDPNIVTDKHLITPNIAISTAAAQITFRNFYNLEDTFDGGVLEVSSPNINGGAFTDVTNAAVGGNFVSGGYTDTISTSFQSPIAGRMAWSGNAGAYQTTVANLGPNVNGQTIKLRFRMASDNSVSATGWRVDTIAIAGGPCGTPSATPTATATSTGTPAPSATPSCPPVITQSSTQTITTGNSVSCNNGVGHTDNSYWRAFNMLTAVGGAGYEVTSVDFGVESANNTQPVTVRLYTNSGAPFPGGTRTQIATTTVSVTAAQTGTVVNAPITASVPAGTSELVMEVFTPDGQATGNLLFIGSNADPESGTSYLSAAACGVTNPTPVATLGFPNMHLVFNVHGSCGGLSPTPTVTATATATATSTAGGTTPTPTPTVTETPTATPSASPAAAQALNLSTRMLILTGDQVGIGGFIVTGNEPKTVLVRGIGPSLSKFGVPNPLADPTMELHGPSGFVTLNNNNWRDTQEAEIQATGLAPTNDLESAILATLPPGNYTAVVKGVDNGTGVGLVEAFDLGQAADSKLGNISTRAFVSTGSDIMIAGFILGNGSEPTNMILRGIGPSLSNFGVPDALADPTLELRDDNGALLRANDNWMDDPEQAAIITAAGLALSNNLESGIAATLPPGQYTALLAGLNGGTGNGLVEAYDLGGGAPIVTPTPSVGPTATATATAGGTPPPTPTATATAAGSPPPGPCVENWDSVTAPALPAGWVATNPDPGDGTMWVTSTISPDTAPNDAFVPDQDGISDKVLDRMSVTVNSASSVFSFRNNFDTEFSDGIYWDGYVLEVSSPNISGGDFLDITDSHVGGSFVSGGYTGEIDGTANNPLAGRMAWSSSSNGYIDTAINPWAKPGRANGDVPFPDGNGRSSGSARSPSRHDLNLQRVLPIAKFLLQLG